MDTTFRQVDLSIDHCITRGWAITKENLGEFIGFALCLVGINIFVGIISFIWSYAMRTMYPSIAGEILSSILEFTSSWVLNLINFPLFAGFFVYALKKLRGEAASFGDFFGGFQYFLQLFLLGLVSGIIILIGILLCILPGLYLGMAYMFASLLVIGSGLDFWQAMETSRRAVNANFGSVFVLVLALIGINIAGALACLLGLLVTLPLSYCAIAVAYQLFFEEEVPPLPSHGPIVI